MPLDPSANALSKLAQLEFGPAIPILALPEAVLFPGTVLQVELRTHDAAGLAAHLEANTDDLLGVFTSKRGPNEDGAAPDVHPVGALASVMSMNVSKSDGAVELVLLGVGRAEILAFEPGEPFLRARVRQAKETEAADAELDALFQNLRQGIGAVMRQLRVPRQVSEQVAAVDSPGPLADLIASRMEATADEKAAILGLLDVKERVRAVLTYVLRRTEVLKMRESIDAQVQSEMGKKQREHLLRQQMKAIEKELGEDDDDGESDIDVLAKRVEEAKLSDDAREVADKQVKRLRTMQPGSPEFGGTRTYVEWIIDLPWTASTADRTDLAGVRAQLDADHHGLDKVKRRIVEYLAVRKLKNDKKGPILCLVGPPGVGKTSLGRSVASALGRRFHRISLGGVNDEASVRGHRRTYVGALPGNLIQGMKKVGVTNPVFMLDEVDKLASDGFRGSPSSALLEVLDPEQNNTFTDHYLEIPYDLSDVMFIATANVLDEIPAPLRDRMEVIEIPGYTRYEKLAIARSHLVPKQLSEHGIPSEKLEFTDDALRTIIDLYTREAGVRSLEKKLAAIVRGVTVRFAEGRDEATRVHTEEDVRAFLGTAPFEDQRVERGGESGIATGLAWTPVGGTILFVETTRMPGSGKLVLTGQLGDVMKESAMAALSYVRANTQRWGLARDFLDKSDIHIHVPAGAMPKDGPSAGVTMLTALVSLLTGIPVRHDVAMTGEITLRGRVLPIGGLKEKVLAAHRAGIKRIIAPERNRADLEEIPADVQRDLDFVFVSQMGQVIDAALEVPPVAALMTTPDAGFAAPVAS